MSTPYATLKESTERLTTWRSLYGIYAHWQTNAHGLALTCRKDFKDGKHASEAITVPWEDAGKPGALEHAENWVLDYFGKRGFLTREGAA